MTDKTASSFADKWQNNPDLAFAQTLDERSEIFNWILNRNGFRNAGELRDYLKDKQRILDAGCGNGRVSALLSRHCSNPDTTIVAVDLVAADVARENLRGDPRVTVLQKDLLGDLRDLGQFDFIYSQEVLHHTADPRRAFSNLGALLKPGGELAVYVYKKKAPLREYSDDYVRDRISGLPYEQAMAVCRQITSLGKALAESNAVVQVPAVDALEIPAGTYPVQRVLYHFFLKCFWNPEFSFHENAVINYDWFHPQLCSRHTLEEVRGWYQGEKLRITHEHVDFYGITMRGRRD
jgi:SAM-dependent methyltransferase